MDKNTANLRRLHLKKGTLPFLLNHAGIDTEIMDVNQNPRPRKVLIIGHQSGYGTEKDLESIE